MAQQGGESDTPPAKRLRHAIEDFDAQAVFAAAPLGGHLQHAARDRWADGVAGPLRVVSLHRTNGSSRHSDTTSAGVPDCYVSLAETGVLSSQLRSMNSEDADILSAAVAAAAARAAYPCFSRPAAHEAAGAEPQPWAQNSHAPQYPLQQAHRHALVRADCQDGRPQGRPLPPPQQVHQPREPRAFTWDRAVWSGADNRDHDPYGSATDSRAAWSTQSDLGLGTGGVPGAAGLADGIGGGAGWAGAGLRGRERELGLSQLLSPGHANRQEALQLLGLLLQQQGQGQGQQQGWTDGAHGSAQGRSGYGSGEELGQGVGRSPPLRGGAAAEDSQPPLQLQLQLQLQPHPQQQQQQEQQQHVLHRHDSLDLMQGWQQGQHDQQVAQMVHRAWQQRQQQQHALQQGPYGEAQPARAHPFPELRRAQHPYRPDFDTPLRQGQGQLQLQGQEQGGGRAQPRDAPALLLEQPQEQQQHSQHQQQSLYLHHHHHQQQQQQRLLRLAHQGVEPELEGPDEEDVLQLEMLGYELGDDRGLATTAAAAGPAAQPPAAAPAAAAQGGVPPGRSAASEASEPLLLEPSGGAAAWPVAAGEPWEPGGGGGAAPWEAAAAPAASVAAGVPQWEDAMAVLTALSRSSEDGGGCSCRGAGGVGGAGTRPTVGDAQQPSETSRVVASSAGAAEAAWAPRDGSRADAAADGGGGGGAAAAAVVAEERPARKRRERYRSVGELARTLPTVTVEQALAGEGLKPLPAAEVPAEWAVGGATA